MIRNDTQTAGFKPNAEPGTPEYKAAVAEPTMGAIDQMPRHFRELVYRFGYIDVYRAWRAGWNVDKILEHAKGDVFEFKRGN